MMEGGSGEKAQGSSQEVGYKTQIVSLGEERKDILENKKPQRKIFLKRNQQMAA